MFYKKMVIVVRDDLGMSRGKIAAQTAHVAVRSVKRASRIDVFLWEKFSKEKKVVLKVDSLDKLWEIRDVCRGAKLPYSMVQDAGMTEIPSGTWTAIAIGPASVTDIDMITGGLSLL